VAGTSFGIDARRRARGPWVERLARAGLVAKGVSYALVAVLAIEVAYRAGGKTATRQEALRELGDDPLGAAVLVLLAIGFGGYTLWRFADALLDRRDAGDDAAGLAKRAGAFGRGCIYAGLLWSTIAVLLGSGGGEHDSGQARSQTAGVFDWPAGRWLVLAVALGIAAAALWNLYRGLTANFEEKLERSPGFVKTVGVAGHLARAVVFGLVAWFLLKAVVEYDPQEARSLDGALAALAAQPHGKALLGVTAAGLLAYGVYCLAEARWRRV
jgi:hypothetical protein